MTTLTHQWVHRYTIADVLRKSGAPMSKVSVISAGSTGGSKMAGGLSVPQKSDISTGKPLKTEESARQYKGKNGNN